MSEDTSKQLDKCSENIETIIKHENSKENVQTIDLRSSMIGKKTNRTYDLIDDEIKVVNLDNDFVVKLIANNKGVFIDFRKYYKGYRLSCLYRRDRSRQSGVHRYKGTWT